MTSLADAVARVSQLCDSLDARLRAEAIADFRLILDALDRASPEAVREQAARVVDDMIAKVKEPGVTAFYGEAQVNEIIAAWTSIAAAIRAMELPDPAREAGG